MQEWFDMIERIGDLRTFHSASMPIGITMNGSITRSGLAVMGRGCALQAATRFSKIRSALGRRLREAGNHVYWFPDFGVFTLPVKPRWYERADCALIRRSARELMQPAADRDRRLVVLPRPGCGNGGRSWGEVRPILADLLDDRVVVITHNLEER